MFSEYASRFLAQSQSRLIGLGDIRQPTSSDNSHNDPFQSQQQPQQKRRQRDNRPYNFYSPSSQQQQQQQQQQDPSSSRFQSTRSYLSRVAPYGASSHLPFARGGSTTTQPAPLFHSAHDDFDERDAEEEEHEREVADFYALQRSRRHFGIGSGSNGGGASGGDQYNPARGPGRPSRLGGGDGSPTRVRSSMMMENIGLESVMEDEPPHDLAVEMDEEESDASATNDEQEDGVQRQQKRQGKRPQRQRPPPVQQFRQTPHFQDFDASRMTVAEDEQEGDSPPGLSHAEMVSARHDPFWGSLFLISWAALLSSFVLAYLHTSAPTRKNPIGDTIYTTLHGSYHLLAVDTVAAVLVSLVWIALLRSYVRPLVYMTLVAVPSVLISFFIYPLVASFQGAYNGKSAQDQAMRWFSFVPGVLAVFWSFMVFKGRHSFSKAIDILEFSCRILADNPALILVGFGVLATVIVWTWLWIVMFARIFLGGHLLANAKLYVIGAGTWWLGAFFVIVYLWTLGVLSGIQRATTAATVSQWYFHRLTVPAPSSRQVVQAAFNHAMTTLFGTVGLAALLALAIRLPYLLLPRRFFALAGLCSYTVLPSSIATLTNPLTLTYAAIHSLPLVPASRALARLSYVIPTASDDTGPTRRNFSAQGRLATAQQLPIHSYTLSLLLLRSTRLITSLALGFGGWVSTARSLSLPSSSSASTASAPDGTKGSLYAYVVGLLAAVIAWAVLGAIDGIIAGIVDAVLVCWGSEVARAGPGGSLVRYCREADHLFGGSSGGYIAGGSSGAYAGGTASAGGGREGAPRPGGKAPDARGVEAEGLLQQDV